MRGGRPKVREFIESVLGALIFVVIFFLAITLANL